VQLRILSSHDRVFDLFHGGADIWIAVELFFLLVVEGELGALVGRLCDTFTVCKGLIGRVVRGELLAFDQRLDVVLHQCLHVLHPCEGSEGREVCQAETNKS